MASLCWDRLPTENSPVDSKCSYSPKPHRTLSTRATEQEVSLNGYTADRLSSARRRTSKDLSPLSHDTGGGLFLNSYQVDEAVAPHKLEILMASTIAEMLPHLQLGQGICVLDRSLVALANLLVGTDMVTGEHHATDATRCEPRKKYSTSWTQSLRGPGGRELVRSDEHRSAPMANGRHDNDRDCAKHEESGKRVQHGRCRSYK